MLDFTKPYYYTPAQMASNDRRDHRRSTGSPARQSASARRRPTSTGSRATLRLRRRDRLWPQAAPAGVTATTLPTDANCAEAWQAGRYEFDGLAELVDDGPGRHRLGHPDHTVGDPVFFEPLAVAIDKSGPAHSQLLTALDQIVQTCTPTAR